MFIIYGTKSLKKVLGQHKHQLTCSNCNNNVQNIFVSNWRWFTLFWIPIFPVSKKRYYGLCPICNHGYEYAKEDIEQMLSTQENYNAEDVVDVSGVVSEEVE